MGECASDFSARLRQVMAELNLSRLTLSRELGVDRSVIGRWLGGVNQPTGHNLTRLTDIVRRYRPEVTVEFWQQPLPAPVNGKAYPNTHEPAAEVLTITGLRAKQRTEIDANYLGLWGGFYQSTQNRGSVVLAAMHVWDSEAGLRCTFTEGRVSATGAGVAIGPRLHVILEIEPMHDRLLPVRLQRRRLTGRGADGWHLHDQCRRNGHLRGSQPDRSVPPRRRR